MIYVFSFSDCVQLVNLDLSGNELKKLPDMTQFENLKELRLNYAEHRLRRSLKGYEWPKKLEILELTFPEGYDLPPNLFASLSNTKRDKGGVKQISLKADVSKKNLHHHFLNKEEIHFHSKQKKIVL